MVYAVSSLYLFLSAVLHCYVTAQAVLSRSCRTGTGGEMLEKSMENGHAPNSPVISSAVVALDADACAVAVA